MFIIAAKIGWLRAFFRNGDKKNRREVIFLYYLKSTILFSTGKIPQNDVNL